MRIDHVEAKSILDTRGRATVETTLFANTLAATASVPSGKSTGSHEARELRDLDGSVTRAIENVNGEMASALVGRQFESLDELDTFLIELDGTPDKSRLGANAILSVSIAAMRLSAMLENIPLWKAIATRAGDEKTIFESVPSAAQRNALKNGLSRSGMPRLFVNVMNGGVHADFKLPFQEYLLVVDGKTSDAFPVAQKMFAKLGERLGDVAMGDEGGYAPTFDTLERPFEILTELIKEFPNVKIAIDAAASELFHGGVYQLLEKSYTAEELLHLYENLVARFSIHSIEDPFAEQAFEDFAKLTASLGNPSTSLGTGEILIIGDDLTVTNPVRIVNAAKNKEINTVLIKPNQVGTVRETLEAVKETYSAGFKAIASHRSGETDDTFIADFAYGIDAHGIKAGGFGQRERLVKYERLLAIEREAEAV